MPEPHPLPATALYAGLHGLLAVLFANYVLYTRLRADRLPAWRVDAAVRVQANFVENVPLALVLLLVLELSGLGRTAAHTLGGTLFALRVLHAWGLGGFEGPNYPRLIGAQGTFLIIAVMAFAAIFSTLA